MTRWCLAAAFALAATACKKGGVCGGNELLVEVSGNHGHDIRIPAGSLERGAGLFRLEGGSHDHAFRLDEAALASLKAGTSVETRTSSSNGHVHAVRLTCAR